MCIIGYALVLTDVMDDVSQSLRVVCIEFVCNVLGKNLGRIDPKEEASSIKKLLS